MDRTPNESLVSTETNSREENSPAAQARIETRNLSITSPALLPNELSEVVVAVVVVVVLVLLLLLLLLVVAVCGGKIDRSLVLFFSFFARSGLPKLFTAAACFARRLG